MSALPDHIMSPAELAHSQHLLEVQRSARLLRDEKRGAVKDKRYRHYPLGREIRQFLIWFENEYGAAERSVDAYERDLHHLALEFADLTLSDFEPPLGTERIREFISDKWGNVSASTRAKVTSEYKSFFKWAQSEGKMIADPTIAIRRPKRRTPMRRAHDPEYIRGIVLSQPLLRDRVAIELMARLGLRKNELRTLKIEQIDLAYGDLRVQAKGKGWDTVPLVYEDLRLRLERYILEEEAGPDEYLLYPSGVRPSRKVGGEWIYETARQDKHRPLEPSAMHNWWVRCVKRAGVPHFPMHELRHTAVTEFIRSTGNIELARMLARHASVATTVDIYAHLTKGDLTAAMKSSYVPWFDKE